MVEDLNDGALLEQFSAARTERAFEELVRRHSTLVLRACRRVLGPGSDAEDAAQAVFLALAQKAPRLRHLRSVAGWLHRVAWYVARDARRARATRAKHEQEVARMLPARDSVEVGEEVRAHLDGELDGLPEKYRLPLVLHHLEGRTQQEAAGLLGVGESTFSMRLLRGRELLRDRLARRGAVFSVGALASLLSAESGVVEIPPLFVGATVKAACLSAAGNWAASAAANGASAHVLALTKGVLNAMFWKTVTLKIGLPATILLLACGLGMWAVNGADTTVTSQNQPADRRPPAEQKTPAAAQGEAKGNLSARADALRARFAQYYKPVKLDLKAPQAPQYALPLDSAKVENWNAIRPLYLAGKDAAQAEKLLKQNGFVATGFGGDNVSDFYERLQKQGVPIFVTSDSLLHLYHIQFGETLKEIEEREFFQDALALAKTLFEASVKQQGEFADTRLKEAARRNAAYFAVALECLAHDGLKDELTKARAEVSAWSDQNFYRKASDFPRDFPSAYTVARAQAKREQWEPGKTELLKALDQALAASSHGKKELEYVLGENIRKEVAEELALIEAHAGFSPSPIFKYKEDYSQYVPRGHYTRSEKLKRYFKALMWFGRLTFIIKGPSDPGGALDGLTDEDARLQTTGGLLAAHLLNTEKLADGRSTAAVWDRLYAVTAYYVGLADDLTPYEYTDAAAKALGARYQPADLANDKSFKSCKLELAKLRGPEIYGGMGGLIGPPAELAGEADLLKALEKTKGFRLMGQRYIPDSFMLGSLVYPSVGPWGGGPNAFTTVETGAGLVRGFPRGLDVMAVLGSNRARAILKELRDDNYPKTAGAKSYEQALAGLRTQFALVDERGWNRNLYWAWLHCLRALLDSREGAAKGLPTFMQTTAWQDKQLHAALASWSQLRHDTILYAKQSYTMETGAGPQMPKMVEGYVEPVPEFYARLLALTRMTKEGLGAMKVLSKEAEARLGTVDTVLVRLLDISTRELQNEKLRVEDYAFIRGFADQIQGAVAGVADSGLETTLIADVHTDSNSQQCLEEGTGLLRNLVVVYPMPDGGFVAGVGPAFSYYEFKQPMRDRLTDEKWKTMLRGAQPPAPPEWVGSFATKP